jgi:hypothetical protein
LQKGNIVSEQEIRLNHRDTWTGEYLGLRFEIVRWRISPDSDKDTWNYYVIFPKKKLSGEVFAAIGAGFNEGKWGWDYYSSPLSELPWHCGITFGEIVRDYEQEAVAIKAGCDYSHLYDEGKTYYLEYLLSDVKETIEGFLGLKARLESPQSANHGER